MVLVAAADFGRLRDGIFDLYQRAIPREVERVPARIVEIDDASLAHVGPWPWPRSLLARLAQNVVDRGALSVGFDVLFPEPDRHSATHFVGLHDSLPEQTRETLLNLPDPDQALAAVIGRSPIVLGRVGINDALVATTGDPEQFPIEAEFVGGEPSGLLSFESGIANIADLDEVAAGHGMLNGAPDRDGIIRRVPLVTRVGGRLTPSFALELLRVAIGADEIELDVVDDRLNVVKLGGQVIQTDAHGFLRPHFSAAFEARSVSALEVLDGTLAEDEFENSVVIIAAAAIGLEDVVSTPIVSESYGADLHAQAIEVMLADGSLKRPIWVVVLEWGLAIGLGIAAILGLPRLPPMRSVAAVVASGSTLTKDSHGLHDVRVSWNAKRYPCER